MMCYVIDKTAGITYEIEDYAVQTLIKMISDKGHEYEWGVK